MKNLFETSKIKTLELKNRFIMAAADDNCDFEMKMKRFSTLADGEIGLIISGGQTSNEIPSWEKIIKEVHKKNGKIAIQIVNDIGGRFSYSNEESFAVSELDENSIFFQNDFIKYTKHHQASEKEIKDMIDLYANAAFLAKSINADAIEIHSAHHSILSQFLSPITNKRKDNWGGSIENRCRIHREILKAIRIKVGNDFPILIKLGVEDAFKDGLKFEDGKKIAILLSEFGYDAIEISQGLQDFSHWDTTPMHIDITTKEKEGYYNKWAEEIKRFVKIPIIVTGGLRSFDLIKSVIENNQADYIGLCRPFIREPHLIKRWKNNDFKKASCLSCNLCISELLMKGLPLECFLDKK